MSWNTDTTWVEVEILGHTGEALLVEVEGEEVWIPRSCVQDFFAPKDGTVEEATEIEIPTELAESKGII